MRGIVTTLKETFKTVSKILNNGSESSIISTFESKLGTTAMGIMLLATVTTSSFGSDNNMLGSPVNGIVSKNTSVIETKKERSTLKIKIQKNSLENTKILAKDLNKVETKKINQRLNNNKTLVEESLNTEVKITNEVEEKVKNIDLENIDMDNLEQGQEFCKQIFSNNMSEKAKEWFGKKIKSFDLENLTVDTNDEKLKEEYLKSAIIYQYLSLGNEKILFNEKKDINERISLTTSLLATVSDLETGRYQHNISIFSPTRAFGRYQIIRTTGQEVFVKYLQKNNMDLNKINSTKFEKKELTLEVDNIVKYFSDKHKERTGEDWSKSYKKEQEINTLSLLRRFVYALKEDMKTNKDLDSYIKKVEKDSGMKTGFLVREKYVEMMKHPELQGVMSLATLEDKLVVYNRLNKENKKTPELEKIRKLFELYNGDVNNTKIVNGKEMTTREAYGINGKNIFNKYNKTVVYKGNRPQFNLETYYRSLN